MAEWSIAEVLKTSEPQGSGGSNPPLSASLLLQIEGVKIRPQLGCPVYWATLQHESATVHGQPVQKPERNRFVAWRRSPLRKTYPKDHQTPRRLHTARVITSR